MSTGEEIPASSLVYTEDGSTIRLSVELQAYRLTAIHKAGYRLAKRFTLLVADVNGTRASVVLILPSSAREPAGEVVAAFYRELADQELRESIAEQTNDIRALLLAHAFSRTDLVRRD